MDETILSGGLLRHYRLHIPTGYRDNVEQALVLNFHGHAGSVAGQEQLTGFSALADQQDFIVVYPQGIVGPDGHTGWSTGPARNPQVNDVLFVSDLLNHLQATLCINPERIYATGFSNGGGMTNMLACKMSMRIAAFAPVSGAYPDVPGGCHPGRPVPILEIHGTADHVVPYNGSKAKGYPPIQQWLQQWAIRDDCTLNPVISTLQPRVVEEHWLNCRESNTLIHYRIVGEGHTWPSQNLFDTRIYLSGRKKRLSPIDATVLIWEFFQAHPLPTK